MISRKLIRTLYQLCFFLSLKLTFVTYWLPLQTVWSQIRPHNMSGLFYTLKKWLFRKPLTIGDITEVDKDFVPAKFFTHLSRRLRGELLVYQWLWRPSSVRQHFQTSSPLKPLGQLNSNFIWRLLRTGEQKFVQMFLVTWPRWPPCPYMVKTLLKSSSPEP